MVKQYNKNMAEVAILIYIYIYIYIYIFLIMQYGSGTAWTSKGKKKEIQPLKSRRQRRLKKKIPSTTTERGRDVDNK